MDYNFIQSKYLEKLDEFYKNPSSGVCFVEGKAGFYKTPLVNESLKHQAEAYLIFKIKCFESTTLDDIYLSLTENLKQYVQEKKLTLDKGDTLPIGQKIKKYISHINIPTIFVFDSLENIFNKTNQEDKEEILRFIAYLNTLNKFKIILISTFFPININGLLEISNFTKKINISLQPLNEKEVKDIFNKKDISIGQSLSEFYSLTQGNPTHVYTTINIINASNNSLDKLIEEFKTKQQSFDDYLIQKLITFVPDNTRKSIYMLSIFQGGLSIKFLTNNDLFTKEQILYLEEKGLLTNEYGLVYVKDFFKKSINKTIDLYEKIKIHAIWRDYYSKQLPLKPSERTVLISRNTMRSQIEYHGSFVIEQKNKDNNKTDMSLLSYLNSNLTDWNFMSKIENKKQRPEKPDSLKKEEIKNNFEKYELTQKELSLLSVPFDINKKAEDEAKERLYRTIEQREEEKRKSNKTLEILLNDALQYENAHDFENATVIYLQALEKKDDDKYKENNAFILQKLAFCCKKMNKLTESIDFFNKLINLYTENNDEENINQTKLEIAKIHKQTLKISHARIIYENFINNKIPASDKIRMCSYIELADIEEDVSNPDKAIEYYKKAFAITETMQKDNLSDSLCDILSEAYFKYALILDDYHQTQAALNYYQKCINTSQKPSVYLSSSYTNLGEILKETGNLKKAIEYFKLSIEVDEKLSNNEGIFYVCKKISDIYKKIDLTQTEDWLLKSLSAAKRTQESTFINIAYKELADFYKEINNEEKVNKTIFLAKKYSNLEQK